MEKNSIVVCLQGLCVGLCVFIIKKKQLSNIQTLLYVQGKYLLFKQVTCM